MGKYLDKTGLQYFYNKLKEKFADKTTIEAKLDSLTGAFLWKGKFDTLPPVDDYEAGNVVGVGKKEYVLTVTEGTKAWEEFGDEGSYLLKTTAEETYLKKADGEVKTANLADGSVTEKKLDENVLNQLIKAVFDSDSAMSDATIALRKTTDFINAFKSYSKYVELYSDNTTDHKHANITAIDNYSNNAMGGTVNDPTIYEIPITVDSKYGLIFAENGTYNYASDPCDCYGFLLKNSSYELITIASDGTFSRRDVVGDGSVSKSKLSTDVQTSLGKADNSLQIGATNTQTAQTVITTESTDNWGSGFKVQNSSSGTEVVPAGITFGKDEQPIGIYKNGSFELNLKSASNNNLKITGLDTPTVDTGAANKAYVDGKVSNTVQTTAQTLTAEQKAQARKNIDVDYLTEDEVANLWGTTI